ncbi:MAG TPA: hypothetical protein VI432_01675 [Candidatus Paceibacterota bacterium]
MHNFEQPPASGENDKELIERQFETAASLFKDGVESGELDLSKDIEILAGNNSHEARALKREALSGVETPDHLREFAESISGDHSDEAGEWRKKIAESPHALDFLARSFAGEKPDSATYDRLVEMSERGAALDPILRGLSGDDSPKAWEIRQKMVDRVLEGDEWPVAGSVFQSLAGVESKEADDMRLKLKTFLGSGESKYSPVRNPGEVNPATAKQIMDGGMVDGADMIAFAHSIAGVDSPSATEFRRDLQNVTDSPAKLEALIVSVTGLDTPEAEGIRNQVLDIKDLKDREYYLGLVAKSLAGTTGERAEMLRLKLQEQGVSRKSLIAGMHKAFVFNHKPL